MSGSLKVNVGAELNDSDFQAVARSIERQFNSMGQSVAKASKLKFEPVSIKSRKDLEDIEKRMKSLLTIQTELARRAKATNQDHLGPLSYDYSKLYTNESTRVRKMQEVVQYLGGEFGGKKHSWKQDNSIGAQFARMGVGAAQAGLKGASGATGGVGGVAAGALGTGMSAGFGAGMMGLLGGILALGVGKMVGAVTEKIGQAEDNNVAYDKLKRTLGDVNVGFNALKIAIGGTRNTIGTIGGLANDNGLRFSDAISLATQYAKHGNLSGQNLSGLTGEVGTGIGLSRSYGLDPSQGVGVLGQMRGIGVTKSEQDTRKFALLIGETIGKSGAFAKADEVMESIGNYAAMQTRATFGGVNTGGYAGMFSGLVGSGIPGLDPAGAGGLLNRINASLSSGGAKGEASQFFTARLGAARGMDVFDTQLWREGGAFSTADSTFGGKGAVGKFYEKYGLQKPGGSESLLSANLSQLKADYGNNPKMMLMATANQMGLSMSQAAALHVVDPNTMGQFEKYGNVSEFSASGIGNLSKALGGTAADRQAMASEFLGRTGKGALSKADADLIESKRGDDGALKEVLAKLSVKYGQEENTGTIARDSKALLDNIKVAMADRLVPMTNEIRLGILSMAGAGKGKSTLDIMKSVIDADSKARTDAMQSNFNRSYGAISDRRSELRDKLGSMTDDKLNRTYHDQPEILKEKLAERAALQREFAETEKKTLALQEEHAKALAKETEARKREIDQIERDIKQREEAEEQIRRATDEQEKIRTSVSTGGGGSGGGAGGDALFDALLQQESGGRHRDKNGRLITSSAGAVGIAQLMPGTAANPGFDIKPVQDDSEAENKRVGREYLNAMLKKYGGDRRKALAAYNTGPGNVDAAISKHGDNWLSGLPKETRNYVPSVLGRVGNTPMPQDAIAAQRAGDQNMMNGHISIDPLAITVQSPNGQPLAQTQHLTPYFHRATPFGRAI